MRSIVPDISWLGRVFETSEHMGIGADYWAAVTLVGDREENESEDTPPRGMRVSVFNSEAEARVAAAKALKEAHGAAALSPVQRKYAQRRPGHEQVQLRAVAAKDAGKLGGNRAAARSYWEHVDAKEGRRKRDRDATPSGTRPQDEGAPPRDEEEGTRTPPPAPNAIPRDRGDARPWPPWCVEAGGERDEFSLHTVDLGAAFGGVAQVGGAIYADGGTLYYVRLQDGTVLQPLPAQIIECALQPDKSTTKEWLLTGSDRGEGVDVSSFNLLSTAVLGAMLNKYTPGEYLVSAAALRELARATSVKMSDMGLPASDHDLSRADGMKLAVGLECRLMRLFRGKEVVDVTETVTSPSPLRRRMRRRAAESGATPQSADSTASSRAPDERSHRARKAVSFAPAVSVDSDEESESVTQRLSRALSNEQWAAFATDALALLKIDIADSLVGRHLALYSARICIRRIRIYITLPR